MVNISYRAARLQGSLVRSAYSRMLPRIAARPVAQTRKVPFSVYSFSGERYVPEQVACLRSFIRYIGVPDNYTVVSDGSLTRKSSDILRRVNGCVNVTLWNELATVLPPCVKSFADKNAMGKKLAVLISLPIRQTTIYTDADILFFRGAINLVELAETNDRSAWYLPDCLPSLDSSILHHESEFRNPVNAGFMLLKEPLNWSEPLQRFAAFKGIPFANTEQTLVHLAMHQSKAAPLHPEQFVLSLKDQFIYRDLYSGRNIALRHYVSNVRHKFWQSILWA